MKLEPITVQLLVNDNTKLEIDKTQPNLVHYVDRRTKSFYFDDVRTTVQDVPMEGAIVVCGTAMWDRIVTSVVQRWQQDDAGSGTDTGEDQTTSVLDTQEKAIEMEREGQEGMMVTTTEAERSMEKTEIRYSYVSITDEQLTDIITGTVISSLEEMQARVWDHASAVSIPTCLFLYHKDKRVIIV
jgi:glutaredoxin-related protein